MSIIDAPFQGSLFANDFLEESITKLDDWTEVDDSALNAFRDSCRAVYDRFPTTGTPNESQTEDDLIWPILLRLGWESSLRQQNLSFHGRSDVPDGLLFASEDSKGRANKFSEEWKRYELGLAVVESKRWLRPLDRRSERRGEETAPSTQMLRYLRRVDDLTTGKLRWGILTNGDRWRLYFQGARSVSEQFFEISLPALLDLPDHNVGLFVLTPAQRAHWLRVFFLVFRRESFLATSTETQTFHQRAADMSRLYEERVAANLSDVVFKGVFPWIAQAISAQEPAAQLSDVREASLIFLYRLLFIFYAEDRGLLPVNNERYDDYALRDRVRNDIGLRTDRGDTFSASAARYWSAIDDLCRAIDGGDASIGLPPYNGGLFDRQRVPLLAKVRLGDSVIADIVDVLSFDRESGQRRYINYRDLGVQQLGSIYERLLEYELRREDGELVIRPNIFARRGSGSYYTPDELVGLIVKETIEPLVSARAAEFGTRAVELAAGNDGESRRIGRLKPLDPASRLLELKICDPAMGSGHFLVNLVDYLTDQVITATAEAEALVENYISPLSERIDTIRNTILNNAEQGGWTIDPEQLDDRHIIRRMILKRCVYGVDKNPMAVELAKVALWLHTFTVGAPLSFLDHHLRCGDSLFGSWVQPGIEKVSRQGGLFLLGPLKRAKSAAASMQIIEGLTDVEIAEAHRSADVFAGVEDSTASLNNLLSLVHALEWLDTSDKEDDKAIATYYTGVFGDQVELASGRVAVKTEIEYGDRFEGLLRKARTLIEQERFLNWQVVFPGVWDKWEEPGLAGGFDAVIGNPPWDRMKLQQVEWFADRKREIALAQRASDRKRLVANLESTNDPLAQDFALASERAATGVRMARDGGDYPLLSGGDLNLYSLFVERSMTIVKPNGMVGLLVPSGIASDKTAAPFFRSVATEGRLSALYDFENKKAFFPDVDSRFKFCVFVASRSRLGKPAKCAFYLHSVDELDDPNRRFEMTAAEFSRVNPNTGTAPIFRTQRDAELTKSAYGRLPVLVDRSTGVEVKAWALRYSTMFHMTNDSGLFRTRDELLESEGAYRSGDGNRFRSASGDWVPLYEGKMVQAFDHRAASVVVNPDNQHRPAQPKTTSLEEHRNPEWSPNPQFWVAVSELPAPPPSHRLAFKDVTAPTNVRSMIAALTPGVAAGNTLPILEIEGHREFDSAILLANFNSIPFDYFARQKIQGQHLNWFIVEQLPVVPPARYEEARFGPKTAAEVIHEAVLELTYTSHDMAPFAAGMRYVDEAGNVKPPFTWDEGRRLNLRAKLDALLFHLYGIDSRDDVRYIYSTFPILEREEIAEYGHYRSLELCLAWMNALRAGHPDAAVQVSQ